jgi:hypothetical protein
MMTEPDGRAGVLVAEQETAKAVGLRIALEASGWP